MNTRTNPKNTISDAEVLDRQREAGWLLPYLWALDVSEIDISALSKKERKAQNIAETAPKFFRGWHRWGYWLTIISTGELPAQPIPRVFFTNQPDRQDARAVQDWLKPGLYGGGWYDELWVDLVKWLLHGFGRQGLEKELGRVSEKLLIHWYKTVNLANLLHSPIDWSAFVLQGNLQDDNRQRSRWSKSTGFFSTPMNVCTMMTDMTFSNSYDKLTDTRLLTVCDPCVGTGSMLLPASNYSLRLYGQDIVRDLCLCTELNGWLWMPWLVFMPDETRKMLEDACERQQRLRKMLRIIRGDCDFPKTPPEATDTPVGINHTDSLESKLLAEQRRDQAEEVWKQASLF